MDTAVDRARSPSPPEEEATPDTDPQRAAPPPLTAWAEGVSLHGLLAVHPQAVAVLDPHAKVIDVNPAFEKTFGYARHEVIGASLAYMIVPAPSIDDFLPELGTPSPIVEVERVRRDGTNIWVRIGVSPAGDTGLSLLTYDDVTSMRRAQKALMEAERRYRHQVESSTDLVWEFDWDGRWMYLNEAARDLFGLPPDELIGTEVARAMPPDVAAEELTILTSVLQGKVLKDRELVFQNRDGDEKYLSFAARPLTDNYGEIVGAQGTARDVGARVAERDALERAREEAERATRAKSIFLAQMSHEIRTPMNGVLGMAEILLDTELSSEQTELAETIRGSGEALLVIINDILDLSKIEAGHIELESIAFDLPKLVTTAVRVFAVRAAQADTELTVHVSSAVAEWVRGDPSKLRQVITNLVSNAVKFTSGGEVAITVAPAEPDAPDKGIRFAVRDSGTGIPADKLEIIFEEFAQADASVTRTHGGTGLGLAICRRLTQLMGGELTVTSEEGTGSEFSFTLALEADEDQHHAHQSADVSLQDKRILIVDDSATGRQVVREILTDAGARIEECANVEDALAALREASASDTPFDLAIVDGIMPERDGFSLAEEVRREERFAQLRLVMLTSAGARGDCRRAQDLAMSAYLTKPVTRWELLEAVKGVMSREGAPDPTHEPITKHSIREERRQLRILLAEDNPVNQTVARTMLEKRGHTVEVVEDGGKAIAAAEAQPFDIVLMDVQMPNVDGLTATRTIRENPALADLPIVALTAHALATERAACEEAGMNDFLTKPFKPNDLFAVVEAWGAGTGPPASDRD